MAIIYLFLTSNQLKYILSLLSSNSVPEVGFLSHKKQNQIYESLNKNIFFKRCIDCTKSLQNVMWEILKPTQMHRSNFKIEFSFLCVDFYNLKDTKTDKEIIFS